MDLAQRKKWQLKRRMESLEEEFESWEDASESGQPFQKHHSQIRSFLWALSDACNAIEEVVNQDPINAAEAREISKVALGVFRVWEFLRSKLAQRREPGFLPFLEMADEYAWHCYQPVRQAGCKEPPLVFLNGGYSPFVMVRDERFQAEAVPLELIRDRTLLQAMASLPFPVIGMPWYQVAAISELSVVAHEVGHSVEADLELDGKLDRLIEGSVTDGERRRLWLTWRSEVFADLWGCLAGGPAFAAALADFLSGEDPGPPPEGFPYPAPPIRFRLNLAYLRVLGFGDAAEGLAAAWAEAYPEAGADGDFVKDCDDVAQALLELVLPDLGKLGQLSFRFNLQQERQARNVAEQVRKGDKPRRGCDLRTLAAAYRYAHDDLAAAGRHGHFELLRLVEDAMGRAVEDDLTSREKAGLDTTRGTHLLRRRSALWLAQLRKGPGGE